MGLTKVMGLWNKKSARGNFYLTGKVQHDVTLRKGQRILVMGNKLRDGDQSPTHIIYIATEEQKPQDYDTQAPAQEPSDAAEPEPFE